MEKVCCCHFLHQCVLLPHHHDHIHPGGLLPTNRWKGRCEMTENDFSRHHLNIFIYHCRDLILCSVSCIKYNASSAIAAILCPIFAQFCTNRSSVLYIIRIFTFLGVRGICFPAKRQIRRLMAFSYLYNKY